MADTVMTPEFRVSFPDVFKAKAFDDNQEAKYGLTMLFPKGTDLTQMVALAKAAVTERWGSKPPSDLRNPFRDGSEKDYEGYEDVTFCNAKSKQRPGIVDQHVQPIIDQDDFYAGCWARATVSAYAYGGKGTKFRPGVAFGLQNAQKIRDDDAFSGRHKAEEDFDPVEFFGAEDEVVEQGSATDMFA